MPNPLIGLVGRTPCGDDGLGWRAAERLRAVVHDPAVEILSVHQLTPELMDPISRADRVIFIDARAGAIPGEVLESTVEPQAGPGGAFSHHATPAALLAGALALYGHAPPATLLTVTGADFSLTEQLSPAVKDRFDGVIATVLREVDSDR